MRLADYQISVFDMLKGENQLRIDISNLLSYVGSNILAKINNNTATSDEVALYYYAISADNSNTLNVSTVTVKYLMTKINPQTDYTNAQIIEFIMEGIPHIKIALKL